MRRGTQYRSAIFYEDEGQKSAAEAVKAQLQKTKFSAPIVTEIVPAGKFWTAEEYHQKYLVANPGGISSLPCQRQNLDMIAVQLNHIRFLKMLHCPQVKFFMSCVR